jgi:alkylation response protein AidB-like acyl-CoA dehydrogenase
VTRDDALGPDAPLNFNEPEATLMLRRTLRRFVEQEMPRELAQQWDRDNVFPRDVFAKLAQLGVMGLTVPEAYGGAGRDIVACMVTIEELARRSCAIATPYIMSACYAGMNILECGTEAQKQALLPRVAAGELLFAYGFTEPDVGADLASVRTFGERRGDRVVINGAKRFCSGPHIANYIYALIRTSRDLPRYRNLSLVLIPPDARGVTIEHVDALGMKGASTADVTFDEVEIPFDNVIGGEARWNNAWELLVGPGLDTEKLEVAALALGIAEAAVADAWDYSQQRQQFGKPICSIQSIRHMLADCQARLHACRLVMYQAAWLADRRLPCRAETSMAKLFVCDVAKEVVLTCQSVLGAYGYVKGFDMERYVREILLMPIIGGSSMIQKNNIANALGLPR